eukprot:9899146-Alexandrium_andersonii.AAC.1
MPQAIGRPPRARQDGLAAATREKEKHQRYPGNKLRAAIVETEGRVGREFWAFLRATASRDPRERSQQLQDVRQRLAAAVQRGSAQLMLTAAGAQLRP